MNKGEQEDNFSRIFREQLDVLRVYGAKFAQENPDLAPYLESGHRKNHDPETERLIESFAYMLSQIETKIIESKTEFGRAALENSFPELVTPTPSMTILKIEANRPALERTIEKVVPKGTVFHTHNEESVVCSFSSMVDVSLSLDEILEFTTTDFIHFNKNENIKNNALILKCNISPSKIDNSEFHTLTLFVNSELESALKIHDNLIANNQYFYVKNGNDVFKIDHSNISYSFDFEHFINKETYQNYIYPLFDFIRFAQKFNFINIKIPKTHLKEKYTEIYFPLLFNDDLYLKKNILVNNCIPVINIFNKNLKTIEYSEDRKEYSVKADLVDDINYEVLSINTVELSDIKANETKMIPCFNNNKISEEEINKNNNSWDKNKIWSVSRSLYSRSKNGKSSRLYLTIRNRIERNKKIEVEKDGVYHVFLTGDCSNGIHPESIRSQKSFDYTGTLPIKSVITLLTASRRVQNKKILSDANFVSEILSINNKISSNYLDDLSLVKRACEIISMNSEDIFIFIEKFFSTAESIVKKDTFKTIYRHGMYFQIPGYEFDIIFAKDTRPSVGAFFIKVFLESYFNHIKSFDYSLWINVISKKD